MEAQYLMPRTNIRLTGSGFAMPNVTDVYYIFLSPTDFGRPNARGMGEAWAQQNTSVRAAIRLLQSLVAFCQYIARIRTDPGKSPAYCGVTRVPCGPGAWGVLFVVIINSPNSVRRLRSLSELPSAAYAAQDFGGAAPVGEDYGEAAAGQRKRRDTGASTRRSLVHFNMADWISRLPEGNPTGERPSKRGAAAGLGNSIPAHLEVDDSHITLLAARAFPESDIGHRADNSGLCTRSFQLCQTPYALDTILGLDATIEMMRRANADAVFLSRLNYEGDPGAISFADDLGFRQIHLPHCKTEQIPSWVFPWNYVPSQKVASRIDDVLLERVRGFRSADNLADDLDDHARLAQAMADVGDTDAERREWALSEILATDKVVASELSFDFYSLRSNAQQSTAEVRNAVHQAFADKRKARGTPEDSVTVKERLAAIAWAMQEHHERLAGHYFPQIEQLLDPATCTIPSIAGYTTIWQDWCFSTATPHARDHNHRFVATVEAERTYSNVSHFQIPITLFMELLNLMGCNTTHGLAVMVDISFGSVGLMVSLRNNLSVVGDPSSGKSMTVSLVTRFFPEASVRVAALVTAKADHVPGSSYMICVQHEVDNSSKAGEAAVMKKALIDSSAGKRISSVQDPVTGKWTQAVDTLALNQVFVDCSNAQATQVDPALRTRFHNTETVESQRTDNAIPRVGNANMGPVKVHFERLRQVTVARRMVMMTISETLNSNMGTAILRLLNRALERVAQKSSVQTVLDGFRGSLRVWNAALVVMFERVGALLFDFPESPFYQRPFAFKDLVAVVLRCCYVDVSDLVFAATLCQENADDATTVALRNAIKSAFFEGRPRGAQPNRGEGAAAAASEPVDRSDPYEAYYVRVTGAEGAEADNERLAALIPGAPNPQPINMGNLEAEAQRVQEEQRNHSIKEYMGTRRGGTRTQRGLRSDETETELSIDALIKHLRLRCVGALRTYSDDALRRRLHSLLLNHDSPMVREGDTQVPRRVRRLEFTAGNIVVSKAWLFSGALPGLASEIMDLIAYDHAPESEWFVTAYQDLRTPQHFVMREVKRDIYTSLVLSPQLSLSKDDMARVNLMYGGKINVVSDNWLLTQRLVIDTDLHRAALQDHMLMNGFTRESYVIGTGAFKVDFYNAVDYWYWAGLPAPKARWVYPPAAEAYNVGHGECKMSDLNLAADDASRDGVLEPDLRAALDAIHNTRTRHMSDVPAALARSASASAGHSRDMPPPEHRPLRRTPTNGTSDFGAFIRSGNIPMASRESPRHGRPMPHHLHPVHQHGSGSSATTHDSGARASGAAVSRAVSNNASRLLGDNEF